MGRMSDRLEETVAEFMYRYGLFAGAERILLAVSGGADSTALLHILMALKAQGRIKADLVCAHINHQLRGPASEADEQFVVAEAKRLGLPVVTRAVDVRAHARKLRLSLETAARQLRLASLAEIARERECAWLGTGHQKNDNAETVLQRLLRGTGFRGLAGIWPVRRFADLQLASPLLCATRAEIVQYLQRRALPWREDATNVDVAYTRNRIRHQLLPGAVWSKSCPNWPRPRQNSTPGSSGKPKRRGPSWSRQPQKRSCSRRQDWLRYPNWSRWK